MTTVPPFVDIRDSVAGDLDALIISDEDFWSNIPHEIDDHDGPVIILRHCLSNRPHDPHDSRLSKRTKANRWRHAATVRCLGTPHPDTLALERVRAILEAAHAGQYARNDTGSMDFGRGIAFLAHLVDDALIPAEAP